MYHLMRWLLGLALGFYFRRIERFHASRVPVSGPVLLASNHPNSLTDSFVIGGSVPRKVNFIATAQLFKVPPVKWILSRCGVIPINRVKDDPRAMRTVAETFEACFRVFEAGEAIGIFPEGITYDDSHLKELKSGAARMALEVEHRHGGRLGLQIVPVGLTYSAKEAYRSDVLVNFGEPISVSGFLAGYEERRKECIHRLTAEIETQIQTLILHLPDLDYERVIAGVKRLYLDRLLIGNRAIEGTVSPRARELLLTQRIAEVVRGVFATQPDRALAFAAKLDFYERWLKRLRFSEAHLALFPNKTTLAGQSFLWALWAIAAAPLAMYGWLHRLIPYLFVQWASERFIQPGKRKAQVSVAAIGAGIVGFGVCYGIYVMVFYRFFGWPAAFWYALSLPVASLAAYYYLRDLRRLAAGLRNFIIMVRSPAASRRLVAIRAELIAEIEAVASEASHSVPANP